MKIWEELAEVFNIFFKPKMRDNCQYFCYILFNSQVLMYTPTLSVGKYNVVLTFVMRLSFQLSDSFSSQTLIWFSKSLQKFLKFIDKIVVPKLQKMGTWTCLSYSFLLNMAKSLLFSYYFFLGFEFIEMEREIDI